jgi:PEP-CTERM motif
VSSLIACFAHADTIISVPQNASASAWGVGPTATIGETLTVPSGDTELLSVTLPLGPQFTGSGSFQFRAYVFAWNAGSSEAAGSALFQSAVTTYGAGAGFTPVTFNPDVNLVAGAQYVFFLSTSGLQSGPEDEVFIATNFNDVYADGTIVFLNNGNDSTQWTTTSWSGPQSGSNLIELAFTADFGHASATPEPSSVLLFAGGLATMSFGVYLKRRAG